MAPPPPAVVAHPRPPVDVEHSPQRHLWHRRGRDLGLAALPVYRADTSLSPPGLVHRASCVGRVLVSNNVPIYVISVLLDLKPVGCG